MKSRSMGRWLCPETFCFLGFIAIVAGILPAMAFATSARDTEGGFIGIRFGHELSTAEQVKSVHYNANVAGVRERHPNGSSMTAENSAEDGFNAFMAHVGYRTFLSDRVYLSGEVEGSVYSNKVQGFFEGTGTHQDRLLDDEKGIKPEHVFPGAWSVEKNHSIGFNARVGYVPQGLAFLGAGRSIYLISGVKWLDATFESTYDNFGSGSHAIRGVTRDSRSVVPWLIGGGLEFGSSRNRFDVRISYSSWSIDYTSGDGTKVDRARVPLDFNVDEVGVSLGYTRSFSIGG